MIRMVKEKDKNVLNERSVAKIRQIDVPRVPDPMDIDEEELYELFELEYEIEYKYSLLKNNRFTGVERRRESILNILEEKGKEVVEYLAETFEIVFQEWLDNHAITDPKKWARQRYYEYGGDSIADIEGVDFALDTLIAELNRYSNYEKEDVLIEALKVNPDIIDPMFPDAWLDDQKQHLKDVLEDDLEVFEDEVYNIFEVDMNFDSKEEAQNFLDNKLESFQDLSKLMGTEQKALGRMVEQLVGIEFFEYADVEQFMDVDDFFITAYEKIVFPVWYDYWSAMGIDETRDTIEEIYDQIVNITKYPLQKQFVVLNTAKNASHQNGSMLEYYEEKWGMDYVLFEKLTEIDTSEWDEELEEIGVVL